MTPEESLGREERGSDEPKSVLVIFGEPHPRGSARFPLTFLKEGFRHCFCVVEYGNGNKTVIEPMWQTVAVFDASEDGHTLRSLQKAYELSGHHTVALPMPSQKEREEKTPASVEMLTCVAFIKKLVGIKAPFVQTPYSLYRRLTRQNG